VARPRSIDNGGTLHDGFQILRTGGEPWQIANTDAVLDVRNPALTKAQALDINGLPTGAPLAVERIAGGIRLRLPATAMYTVLSAE
jgi:hypothetical protein